MNDTNKQLPDEAKSVDEVAESVSVVLTDDEQTQGALMEPARRISAELRGDDAVEADMLETMLRIQEMVRTKVERDSMLVQLAIMSLGRIVSDFRKKTGKRFPTAQDIEDFLHD